MIVAITGTPGVGKTSVSKHLQDKGYFVVDLHEIIYKYDFVEDFDKKRDSKIVDIEKLNQYVSENFKSKKDLVFIESHLSHSLDCIDKVILLRLHPKYLKENLEKRGWNKEKIKENLEAEALDVILCEVVESFAEKDIFEIDTTDKNTEEIGKLIIEIADGEFKDIKSYKIGNIDWSEEILNLERLNFHGP
jgi:adenylate kinase